MKKIFKKFKNKKGFTLVELIITIAILTIVMGMIMGVLTPIIKSYGKSREYLGASDIAKNVALYVRETTKTGTDVYLSDNDDKSYYEGSENRINFANSIYVQNGKLYRRETLSGVAEEVFAAEYWDEYSLQMTFSAHRKEIVAIVIEAQITITNKETGEVCARHTENFEVKNAKSILVKDGVAEESFTVLMFNLPAPEGVPNKDHNEEVAG